MTLQIAPPAGGEFDRLPPHSIEAEMCLIASMMLDKDLAVEASGMMRGETFYLTDHSIMFDAIVSLVNRNKPVDAVILREELKAQGNLDAIGGTAYIAQVLASVPSAAHGHEYMSRVIAKAGLRALISLADNITRRAYNGTETFTQIAEPSMQRLIAIQSRGSAERIVTIGQAAREFALSLDSGASPFIQSGLGALDEEIGGIRLGKMMIVGARPGVGKTMAVKQILRNVAMRGVRCGIVTIEEDREKIVENYASAITGIDNRFIANRTLSASQRAQVDEALESLDSLPIHIADEQVALEEVVAAVTAMKVRHKCDIVAVDHLHLIGLESNANRAEQIRAISGALKSTFKRLKVGGIVCCQLNREGEERPTLRSLREGGSLEQDGDVIVMLHSEDYHRKQRGDPNRDHKLEMLLQKNKGGRCCDIPFFYDAARFTLTDWDDRTPVDEHGNQKEFFNDSEAALR